MSDTMYRTRMIPAVTDLLGTFLRVLFDRVGAAALGRWVVQPLAFLVWLAVFGFWYVTYREGSVSEGWRVIFPDTKIEALTRDAELRAVILQTEIRQAARSDARIKAYLDVLLNAAHGVARIRLGVIHNGVITGNGSGLLKFDVTHAVASAGRVAGDLIQNQPMNGWTRALPDLLLGRCTYFAVSSMDYAAGRDRLARMGTVAVLTCPVTNNTSQLLGALFLQFDRLEDVPEGAALLAMEAAARDAGRLIAVALDLRQP